MSLRAAAATAAAAAAVKNVSRKPFFGCLYLFVVARVFAEDILHELVVLLREVEERLRVVLVRVLVLRRRVAASRRA